MSELLTADDLRDLTQHQHQARLDLGYEPDTPRCGNCAAFKPAVCGVDRFALRDENGCCDAWKSPTGETLACP